ncbi:MAG: glutamate-1-semialdehyde 2,1-aminomutase [Blastocatellia bacterium]|nr:glutamate-1-semialdehyde 2,1-aminomutase [Blastocatellia bacterium]
MSETETYRRSSELFHRAQNYIPGGVNSPVRAFRAVGGEPLFIARASGAEITDADGNNYIDYIGSWGPMILGHAHPEVISAIKEAAERGTSYGAPTELEVEIAQEISASVPSVEKVRLTSSGTEATMSAIRLARGFTGRDRIVKFVGCYHGHGDSLLVKAGSGVATFGLPDSPGVPADLAKNTLTINFNDFAALEEVFDQVGKEIAAIIVEPVVGNMGCVLPKPGYLEKLREVTAKAGSLLIFDEVMTGFRLSRGGAQQIYDIKPDLTCLGKIIGGGLPVGAFGGCKDVMNMLAPVGPVYQAGTLSGNPLAVTAGLATLRLLKDESIYSQVEKATKTLVDGLLEAAKEEGISVTANRAGSMFTLFFTDKEVTDWESAKSSDTAKFAKFFHKMLAEGVYLPPSQFEAGFLGIAHTEKIIEQTLTAARKAFKHLT